MRNILLLWDLGDNREDRGFMDGCANHGFGSVRQVKLCRIIPNKENEKEILCDE